MDLYFILKKTAAIYIHPLTIAMELMVLGVVLVGFSRRRFRRQPGKFSAWLRGFAGDAGVGLLIAGVFFLFLCSINPVANPLLFSLEKRYPPLPIDLMTEVERTEVAPDFILVLGGGDRYDPGKPPTSQLSYAALARVAEGVRLAVVFPKATVVFTGFPNEVRAMTETATALGVSRDRIQSESESRDTDDHPEKVRPIIGDGTFFLVTSGTHMPRAMTLFEAAGYKPTAAACDLWAWPAFGEESPYRPENFIPSVENLWKTQLVFHEYVGMAWIKFNGSEEKQAGRAGEDRRDPIPEKTGPDPATTPVLPLPEKSALPPKPAPEGNATGREYLL